MLKYRFENKRKAVSDRSQVKSDSSSLQQSIIYGRLVCAPETETLFTLAVNPPEGVRVYEG